MGARHRGHRWDRSSAAAARSRACCDGPLAEPALLPAARLVDAVDASVDGPDWAAPVAALRDELLALRDAARTWDPTLDALAAEVSPWLDQARRESEAGLAALRLLQQTHAVGAVDSPDRPDGYEPDPESAMIHAFALLFAWGAARDAPPHVVLGPRFALHPAVVQRHDGAPALDIGLALREDASVVDRLARLALARYSRVMQDGEPAEVRPEPAPPFPDARLT